MMFALLFICIVLVLAAFVNAKVDKQIEALYNRQTKQIKSNGYSMQGKMMKGHGPVQKAEEEHSDVALPSAALAPTFNLTSTFKPKDCDESRKATVGDKIDLNYVGYILSDNGTDSRIFDNSFDRPGFLEFVIGNTHAVPGLEEGVLDMCVGENRTIIVPPEYGYGLLGFGTSIPGNSTLKFEVTCEKITFNDVTAPNVFHEMDTNGNDIITFQEYSSWFSQPKNGGRLPDGLWQNEDKDGNNEVSWAEFSGPKGYRTITLMA